MFKVCVEKGNIFALLCNKSNGPSFFFTKVKITLDALAY